MRHLVLSALILTSCLNEDSNPEFQTNPTEVYLAGYTTISGDVQRDNAAYWKNNEKVLLPGGLIGSNANSIVAFDKDIYVAGIISDDGVSNKPVLWENGNLEVLFMPDTIDQNYWVDIERITVENNDVYVFGKVYDYHGDYSPLLWKNGQLVHLANLAGKSTTSGTVSNLDIYFSGGNGYWKNDTFNEVVGASFIEQIYVVDDKIITAGKGSDDLLGYWIDDANFKSLELPEDKTHIRNSGIVDIEIRNGDVFILGVLNYEGFMSGDMYKDEGTNVVLWKNGSIEQIMGGVALCSARALSVFNNQIYILGSTNLGSVLWKVDNSLKSKVLPSDQHVGAFFLR